MARHDSREFSLLQTAGSCKPFCDATLWSFSRMFYRILSLVALRRPLHTVLCWWLATNQRIVSVFAPPPPRRNAHVCNTTAATVDPETMSGANPAKTQNLVAGKWETNPKEMFPMPDPLNGEVSDVTVKGSVQIVLSALCKFAGIFI